MNYNCLSVDEKKELLKKEIKKIEHDIAISELVYSLHGEDTYEDLFRDNVQTLLEKIDGINLAIKSLDEDGSSNDEYDC
jgi:hypothetical protein